MVSSNMAIRRSVTVAAVLLGMTTFLAAVAEAEQAVSSTRGGVKVLPRILVTDAQLTPATARGTQKVQSRIFNPFDVASKSRLSIDPFGFFTVTPASTSLAPAGGAPSESSTAVLDSVVAGAPVNVAASSVALRAPEFGAVRPPYRPPVRSPFRPPPRPPF